MAFPLTTGLDDFTRASVGTNWQTPWLAFTGTATINTNQLAADAANTTAAGWMQAFGFDCECWVQVPALPAAGSYVGVLMRCDSIQNISGRTRYDVRITPSTSTWALNRIVAGAVTQIGSYSHAFNANDWVGLRSLENTISLYYSSDGIAWSEIGSVSDNGIANTNGFCGVETNGTTGVTRWDNFGGGSLAAAAPGPPVMIWP